MVVRWHGKVSVSGYRRIVGVRRRRWSEEYEDDGGETRNDRLSDVVDRRESPLNDGLPYTMHLLGQVTSVTWSWIEESKVQALTRGDLDQVKPRLGRTEPNRKGEEGSNGVERDRRRVDTRIGARIGGFRGIEKEDKLKVQRRIELAQKCSHRLVIQWTCVRAVCRKKRESDESCRREPFTSGRCIQLDYLKVIRSEWVVMSSRR